MILAVAGGKGGVGKSTVALNLAAELDAVLVDADLTMADLPTAPGPDVHDVLAGTASPIEAVRDGDLLDILPCGRTLSGATTTDPAAIPDVLETIADAYGDVIVDTPAGMEADVGLPLAAADTSLIVTTDHPPAIADAVRTRELASELDAAIARVVLNHASPDADTQRIRTLLGAPVEPIPKSHSLATAQTEGLPVRVVAPKDPVVDAIETLATAVQSVKS